MKDILQPELIMLFFDYVLFRKVYLPEKKRKEKQVGNRSVSTKPISKVVQMVGG